MGWQQFLEQFVLPGVVSHSAYVRRNYPVLEPEDVVQDFYLRLYSIWGRAPQDPDEIRRWLFGVLGNCAREAWRKAEIYITLKKTLEQLSRRGLPPPPPPGLALDIKDALRKLDPMAREAFIDHYLYGITYKVIGRKFGWKTGKANRVIQKARTKLRRLLE